MADCIDSTAGGVDSTDRGTGHRRRNRRVLLVDAAVALGLVAVVAFPLAAGASASTVPPPALAPLPPIGHGPGGQVRSVPLLVPSMGLEPAVLTSQQLLASPSSLTAVLQELATTALGPVQAGRLLALGNGLPPGVPVVDVPHDRGAEGVVDATFAHTAPDARQVAALTDLGALLQLASADQLLPPTVDVDGIALTVLRTAASGGSCAAGLDYLLELLSDPLVPRATLRTQYAATRSSCPRDPTAGWLYGVSQMPAPGGIATFRQLERDFPDSPAGWSGQADVVGIQAQKTAALHQPFTAESQFRTVALLLARAQSFSSRFDPGMAATEATDWTGAGDPGRAVPIDRRVLGVIPGQAARLQLASDLEQTHAFADAGRVLATPDGSSPPTVPVGLYPAPVNSGTVPSLGNGAKRGLTIQGQPTVAAADFVVANVLIPPDRQEFDGGASQQLFSLVSSTNRTVADLRDQLLGGDPGPAGRSTDPVVAALGHLAQAAADRAVAGIAAACSSGAPDSWAPSVATWCDGVGGQDELVGAGPTGTVASADATPPTTVQLDDRISFDLENLWRWAGRLDRADDVTSAWEHRDPGSFLAADQVGEVAYLSGHHRRAARSFARAVRLAPSTSAGQAERLKEGLADGAAGDLSGARRLFTSVGATGDAVPFSLDLRYLAAYQTADLWIRAGHYSAAAGAYQVARGLIPDPRVGTLAVVVPAALDTNEGLADVQAGHAGAGLVLLHHALATDPGSATFLQNVAYAERRLGRTAPAVAAYRRAVASDPTNYPAANDLGVLLADQGKPAAAVAVLRGAVGAGPDYALARFNLGVVLARQGMMHALESDGDRAQAIRIDPGMADDAPVPQFDNGTVITELDLARPPPPGWHFATVERVSPGAAAGLALLVLLVGLGRELVRDKAADEVEERLLERADRAASGTRHRWMRRRTRAVVATVATVVVLTWPLSTSAGATGEADALLAAAVLVLVAVYVRVHLVVGRPAETPLRHHSSVPPLGIAAMAAVVHLAFAPLPVAEAHEERHRHRRWMAPLVIGVTGVGLLIIGRVTAVPSARAFGAAALVITSSALLPIAPSDGAYLGGRLPAMLASGALLIVSSLLFLRIL